MFSPLVGLGRLYVARKESAKAVPPLFAAGKLRPDDPEVPYLIGVAYHRFLEKFDPVQRFGRFFLDYRDFMYEIPARFCAVRFAIIRSN